MLAKSKGPLCQKILAESPWDKRLSGLSAVSLATKSCIKAAHHNLEPCYKSQAENKRRHIKQQRVWNNQIVVFTASQLALKVQLKNVLFLWAQSNSSVWWWIFLNWKTWYGKRVWNQVYIFWHLLCSKTYQFITCKIWWSFALQRSPRIQAFLQQPKIFRMDPEISRINRVFLQLSFFSCTLSAWRKNILLHLAPRLLLFFQSLLSFRDGKRQLLRDLKTKTVAELLETSNVAPLTFWQRLQAVEISDGWFGWLSHC